MSAYGPISIFALQTPDERARIAVLSQALEACDRKDFQTACKQAGVALPALEGGDARSSSLPKDDAPASASAPRAAGGVSRWISAHRAVAACLALLVVLAVGVPAGYVAGWTNGESTATAAAQAQAEAAAQAAAIPPADLAQREANVKTRYKKLGIDMNSMDRVDPDAIEPITVYPVAVKPATELKRIGDVDVSPGTGVQLDVPIVNQLDTSNGGRELMSGCEIASLAMLLRYAGVKVTKEELQDAMPTVPLTGSDGLHGNPNYAFVGDMAGRSAGVPGYSVYHAPVAELAQRYLLNRSFKVVDLTGQSFTVLLKELASGNPCWVITTTSMQPDLVAETWQTAEGPVVVNWALHSVALTGYDDEHIYINDPYGYTQNVPYDRNGFERAWKLMGSQAVVIVPTE